MVQTTGILFTTKAQSTQRKAFEALFVTFVPLWLVRIIVSIILSYD